MKKRTPIAAFGFYPGSKQDLINSIKECFKKAGQSIDYNLANRSPSGPRKIIAGISPHAGYVFSGPTASKLMAEIAHDGKPESFILLGVAHGTYLPISALMQQGAWETPLGDIEIDSELAEAILSNSKVLVDNESAHYNEHSIEVQLPFLQYIFDDIKIVPISISARDIITLEDIGKAIAKASKAIGRDVLILASTDMTHYGMAYGYAPVGNGPIDKVLDYMKKVDGEAIKEIESINPSGLVKLVEESGMTMCGASPVAACLFAVKEYGDVKVETLDYTTSWHAAPKYRSPGQVVGYYSAKITRN